mmetsp:Transcript_136139/g.422995  ORF Transcript_136139/g.422995 Transcript_136139/m.422995 type:complete len:552 (-) Transcript_136139:190-1845(-)
MARRVLGFMFPLFVACGCVHLDESAMLQVTADFMTGGQADFVTSDLLGAGSDLELALDLDLDEAGPDNDLIIFKHSLESAVSIMNKRNIGDQELAANVSKQLVRAWNHDVDNFIKGSIKQLVDGQVQSLTFAQNNFSDTAAKASSALDHFGKWVTSGGLNYQILDWVRRMGETNAAMSRKMFEKSIDWQKLASGSLLLNSQRTGLSNPDEIMFKRSLMSALDIYRRRTEGDNEFMTNMTKTLNKAWQTEVQRTVKQIRQDFVSGLEGNLHNTSTQAQELGNFVGNAVDRWMRENIKEHGLAYKFMDYLRQQMEESSAMARKWLEKSVDWQKLAAGSFLALGSQAMPRDERSIDPVHVLDASPVLYDADAIEEQGALLQRQLADMSRNQDELMMESRGAVQGNDHVVMLKWDAENIKRGVVGRQTLDHIRTSLDATAHVSKMWFDNTVELQKIVTGFFLLASQQTSPKAKSLVEDTKPVFETVLMKQEQMVGDATEDSQIFADGQVSFSTLQRVKAITDRTDAVAHTWLDWNQQYQQLLSSAMLQLARQEDA